MGEHGGKIFVVDDEPATRKRLADGLSDVGYDVTSFDALHAAVDALAIARPDALIANGQSKNMSAREVCARSHGVLPDLPIVFAMSTVDVDAVVDAFRAGAHDVITSQSKRRALVAAAERAVRHGRSSRALAQLRDVSPTSPIAGFVGESEAMQRVYDLIHRLADSEVTALVTGESGTGKELVANALHHQSARRDGPFLAINCAALPETLLESELFGHVRGAFTDARANRTGLLVAAEGGTLFLDEIGEVPLPMQVKLLRALQERRVRPVGAQQEVPFDARIVAATNRDLAALVNQGHFREDLYFRLNVVEIPLPPLRSRGHDVLTLAQHFLAAAQTSVTTIARHAADKLVAYPWPGNVRELQNCIERAAALARFDTITADDLPEKIRGYTTETEPLAQQEMSELVTLGEVERRYILRVLEAASGQRKVAARILGVDRKTLYRKLQRYTEEEAAEAPPSPPAADVK